jgi:hypothetical protein
MAPGYKDTPVIPGTNWHVHDSDRPQPRAVAPTNLPRISPVTPPGDAVVLFDGRSLDEWVNAKTGGPAGWKLEGGCMEVVRKTGNIRSRRTFGDMQLHVEWAAPTVIEGESQGRGNSGVFLMGLYEIQVLDCFQNPTYPDGTTAAVYGQYPPLINACCRPGEFHVYDILWTAPRFTGKELKSPAFVTVLHNGVCVHNHVELQGPTLHREITRYQPHEPAGPVILQDHGNPVRYRNIWVRELKGYDQA